jgi:hypothetical protein
LDAVVFERFAEPERAVGLFDELGVEFLAAEPRSLVAPDDL